MNKVILLIVVASLILGLVGAFARPNPFCESTILNSNICSL